MCQLIASSRAFQRLRIDLADAPTEVGLNSFIEADVSLVSQVGTIVRCRVLGAVCLIDEGRGLLDVDMVPKELSDPDFDGFLGCEVA